MERTYADLSVLNPTIARHINATLAKYKKSIEKSTNEGEEGKIVFHIHFPATRALYELLRTEKYPCTKHAFKDMYLDTIDYALTRQGLWYKDRYEFNYGNGSFSLLETSVKQVHRDADDIPCTYSKIPKESLKLEKKLLPFAAFSFMRHSFKTEFGYLWIEEVSFGPDTAYLLATAVVEDQAKFDDFCLLHLEVGKALALAPVASKIVERIRILRARKPKHIEPLWSALLESRTVVRTDWSSDICKFNPFISGFPISPDDDFWKRKGKMVLCPEELGAL